MSELDLTKPVRFRGYDFKILDVYRSKAGVGLFVAYQATDGCPTWLVLYSDGSYRRDAVASNWDLVNVPDLEIKPGIYRTRGGSTARVYTIHGMGDAPAIGEYHTTQRWRLMQWRRDGYAFLNAVSDFDLVERLGDILPNEE